MIIAEQSYASYRMLNLLPLGQHVWVDHEGDDGQGQVVSQVQQAEQLEEKD